MPCGHLLGKGLLQKETRRSQDSMNIPKIYCITYIFTFYYKYLIYRNDLYLGNNTFLYLIYNRINDFVGV